MPASYPSASGYPPNGYGTPAPSMPPLSGGYAPPVAPPFPAQSAQPWSWNNPGTGGNSNMTPPPALLNPSVPSASYPGTGGQPGLPPPNVFSPHAAPPFPVRPAEPLIRLTPGQRTTLYALLFAIVLGTVGAFGVIKFLEAYQLNAQQTQTRQIIRIMNDGVNAYNAGDYAAAVKFFEQARDTNPTGKNREMVHTNLASSYIQLGRVAESNGRLQDAQAAYRNALEADSYNRTARLDLANLLEKMGQTDAARKERAAANGSIGSGSAPSSLDNYTGTSSGDDAINANPNEFIEDRYGQAMQLIAEGDRLSRSGDLDGARAKWRDAMASGAGTAARDEAKSRLDQTQPASPNWDGF